MDYFISNTIHYQRNVIKIQSLPDNHSRDRHYLQVEGELLGSSFICEDESNINKTELSNPEDPHQKYSTLLKSTLCE